MAEVHAINRHRHQRADNRRNRTQIKFRVLPRRRARRRRYCLRLRLNMTLSAGNNARIRAVNNSNNAVQDILCRRASRRHRVRQRRAVNRRRVNLSNITNITNRQTINYKSGLLRSAKRPRAQRYLCRVKGNTTL